MHFATRREPSLRGCRCWIPGTCLKPDTSLPASRSCVGFAAVILALNPLQPLLAARGSQHTGRRRCAVRRAVWSRIEYDSAGAHSSNVCMFSDCLKQGKGGMQEGGDIQSCAWQAHATRCGIRHKALNMHWMEATKQISMLYNNSGRVAMIARAWHVDTSHHYHTLTCKWPLGQALSPPVSTSLRI